MLDRDEDMLITGGRHPFLARFKVVDRGCVRVGGALLLDPGNKGLGTLDFTLTFYMTVHRNSRRNGFMINSNQSRATRNVLEELASHLPREAQSLL
jgi:hypothetical protein